MGDAFLGHPWEVDAGVGEHIYRSLIRFILLNIKLQVELPNSVLLDELAVFISECEADLDHFELVAVSTDKSVLFWIRSVNNPRKLRIL